MLTCPRAGSGTWTGLVKSLPSVAVPSPGQAQHDGLRLPRTWNPVPVLTVSVADPAASAMSAVAALFAVNVSTGADVVIGRR